MLDRQKQASLSLTMSDFVSLIIVQITNNVNQFFKFTLPVTPTVLRVLTKVVVIHSRATERGIINWNATSALRMNVVNPLKA